MALFQWQEIDPTPEEIAAALVEGYRASGYPQPPTAALLAVATSPERSGGASVAGITPGRHLGGLVAQNPITGVWNEMGLEFGESEEDDCYSLACCPTGTLLAAGGNGWRVRIGDLATGRWLHLVRGLAFIVCELDFAPDGRTLASAHDGIVLFIDPESGSEKGRLALPAGAGVTSLAFSPDGDTIAIGDDHGVARLWPWRRMLAWAR